MLGPGDHVRDFEAVDQFGTTVHLSDFLEAGPLVLFFYVKAKTPGWTIESGAFRDLAAEFAELGAQRAGISPDPVDRNREFDEEENLGFPLLSDPDKSVAALFGSKRFGPVPNKRVTFVIGIDAKIIKVIKSETNMKAHSAEAVEALRSLAPG